MSQLATWFCLRPADSEAVPIGAHRLVWCTPQTQFRACAEMWTGFWPMDWCFSRVWSGHQEPRCIKPWNWEQGRSSESSGSCWGCFARQPCYRCCTTLIVANHRPTWNSWSQQCWWNSLIRWRDGPQRLRYNLSHVSPRSAFRIHCDILHAARGCDDFLEPAMIFGWWRRQVNSLVPAMSSRDKSWPFTMYPQGIH